MSGAEAEERARIQRELDQILKERSLVLKEKMRVEMELERLLQAKAAREAAKEPNLTSSRRQKP